MDTWAGVVAWVVGLIALDQAFIWMERRGWIYWRGGPRVDDTTPRAMARCADCSYLVSRRALSCPACGRLLRPFWLLLGALLVAAIAVGLWRAADMLLGGR